MSFQNYLTELRKSKGYSQKYVAEQLGIIRQTYSHYETGRIVPPVNFLPGIDDIDKYNAFLKENCERISALTENEKVALYYYNSLDDKGKATWIAIMQAKADVEQKWKELPPPHPV